MIESRKREVGQSLKKLTRNQLQGDGGVHRFAVRVGYSGLAFHPTGALDAGIDGFIELRDAETGEVKAQYIAAQLKTVQKLAEDTGETTVCGRLCLDLAPKEFIRPAWRTPGGIGIIGAGQAPSAEPARLFVGEDSAGGTLAAAVASRALCDGVPRLGGQGLVYPIRDDVDLATPGLSLVRADHSITCRRSCWFQEKPNLL